MFKSGKSLLKYCQENKVSISQATLSHEKEFNSLDEDTILEEFRKMYGVMKESSTRGLDETISTMSGIIVGNAKKLEDYRKKGKFLSSNHTIESMARAFSVLEVNGSMGKIVASPTAGASGILPAALVTAQNKFDFTDDQIVRSMVTCAAIGGIIATNATISGAEGGCQAETGSASAMAAAGLVELMEGSVEEAFHAASFAIIHVLGLVCDPIGGLVEFPCALRNASGVNNAVISADLALAGVESIIPFDEVVSSMFEVGNCMPSTLRETALGGLAASPTGCTYCSFK